MSVQFAVLASGSRGNSTLVRGRGAGLLIDVGIGPRAIGERLESVGATWSRIAAAVLTHTHGDHVDTGAFAEMARRGVSLHCHEAHRTALSARRGLSQTRGSPADPSLRCRSVSDLDGAAARADRTAARRRPDIRVSDRGVDGTPATTREHRLPRRHGHLVRNHGGKPGRCRRARSRIQSRRRSPAFVSTPPILDRA